MVILNRQMNEEGQIKYLSKCMGSLAILVHLVLQWPLLMLSALPIITELQGFDHRLQLNVK